MHLQDITDEELFTLALEENEDAKNILYNRFKFIIDLNVQRYRLAAKRLNLDIKDLESEALLGFSDALTSYRQDKIASLPTFINLCVNRRVKKAILKASRLKNLMEKDAFSLDYVYEEYGLPLLDIISDNNKNDPLENITLDEDFTELVNSIKSNLSGLELQVFNYMTAGFNYQQIALMLGKDAKQIDNAMQRLKNKIKNILEKRKND